MSLPTVLQGEIRKTKLGSLIKCSLDDSHRELQFVLEQGVDGRDETRAQALLKFIHGTRQRLLRLRALLVHPIRLRHVGACKSIDWLAALERHQNMLANAADTLFLNHQFFTYAIPVPIFDVSSALSIRSRGFLPLPGCIGQIDSVPKPPSGRRRALLEVEANALVYTLLHQSQWPLGLRLIEVEKGQALLGSESGYEVALLLEPAPPSPLSVIVEALQYLLKPLQASDKPAEADSAPAGGEQGVSRTVSQGQQPAPSATGTEATDKGESSAPGGADSTAQDPSAAKKAEKEGLLPQETIREQLATLGFTEGNFADLQPRWRWRLINLAVSAGSGAGHCMTLSQLHFVRAELDYRMLHGRHAAMTHHLARLIRSQMNAGDLGDAVGYAGGGTGGHCVQAMDVDVAPGEQGQQPVAVNTVDNKAGKGAINTAGAGGAAVDAGELSNVSDGSLQAGATSMQLSKVGGSVDKCLSEEYENLLEAVLSVPLAIMSSVLHDVCATLTFRAAASAARDLQAAPHRWRHHLTVSTTTSRVQVGLRVQIWGNAPLSKDKASTAAGTAPAAFDTAPDFRDFSNPGAISAPGSVPGTVPTNTPPPGAPSTPQVGPGAPQAGQEEPQVIAIPPDCTVVPAVEVGIVNQQLVCIGDPSLEQQWSEARVEEQLGIAVPDLKLDASSVPVEAMLLDYAAACSLAQLLKLQGLLTEEVQRQGWSMDHLEASLSVVKAHSSGPLRDSKPHKPLRDAPGSIGTAAGGAATAAQKGTATEVEMLEEGEEPGDAVVEEETKDGMPAPTTDPDGLLKGGAQDAAAMRSQERHVDVSRGVPVLLVQVRRRLGMSVSFDLVSGALCLHAGESNLPGQSFCTAIELEQIQEELRGIAQGTVPIGTPPGPPLNMLAHALARYVIQQLLTTRAAVRAATALSLRLLPLAPAPQGPPTPYPEASLRTYLRNSPTMGDLFPLHPTFFALPPSPLSLPLCSALMRHGMGRTSFKAKESIPRQRWQRMHFFIAIGLDPNGLNATHASPDHPSSSLGEPLTPFKRARMCAALVCCIAGASSGVRAITLIDPVPTHVFAHAKNLLENGLEASEVLEAVGAHGSTEPSGWFSKIVPDQPCGLSGRKRARVNDSLPKVSDTAERDIDAANASAVGGDQGSGDMHAAHAQKRARVSPSEASENRSIHPDTKPGAAGGGSAASEGGFAGGVTTGAVSASDLIRSTSNDAVLGVSGWGSPDFARERMEVALMTGWLQLRALTAYIVEELRGMSAEFEEQSAPTGTMNPCIPGVSNPRIVIKSMRLSRTERFNFHGGEFVPWPKCIPHLEHSKPVEGTPLDAAVRSVHIVVTGANTWELHIQSNLLASALKALNAAEQACRDASGRSVSQVDHSSSTSIRSSVYHKQKLWHWDAEKPDRIVARYCTLRRVTATHCWQHILSAMCSLQKLNGFAALQTDPEDGSRAPGGGLSGASIATQGTNGTSIAPEIPPGIPRNSMAPIVYTLDVFEVTVRLVSLDAIRVTVSRTKEITMTPVSNQMDAAAASFATFAPQATPVKPHVPVIEVEVTHGLDHRVDENPQAATPGAATPHHILVLIMVCRGQVLSATGASTPSAVASRGIQEAISGSLQRSELRLFIESLAYTSEGILSASRVSSCVGAGHSGTSRQLKPPRPSSEASRMLQKLPRVREIDVQTISSPFRYVINITVATSAPSDESNSNTVCYSVGLMLKSGGLALLQFDQRQFSVHKDLHNKLHVKMLEKQKGGIAGSSISRSKLSVHEVPRYQELVQSLTRGNAPLACMAADVGVAWHAESRTGSDVVIAQGNLHKGIEAIAAFLNST